MGRALSLGAAARVAIRAGLLVVASLGAVLVSASAAVGGSGTRGGSGAAAGWPDVDARAALVMDAGSGRVLYARAPDERRLIASTTKIMTALIAIERGNPDDLVTVSRRAVTVEGSRIYLEEGERESLRDLLYALILRSANDAAVAIAEHVAGSVEEFARLMNEKARNLGCQNTHFVNPHGLDDPDHYSTARDLATIAAHAMKNPTFRELVSTRRWQMPWPAKNSTRVLHSENKLLADEDGTGIKTGYTRAAGHCVVASARRGQLELVVVMLGAGLGFWKDVRALLDHAFACYRPVTVVRSGQPVGSRPLTDGVVVEGVAGADVVVPLLPEEAASVDGRVRTVVRWDPSLRAPVGAGQRVGEVEVYCPGVPAVTVPLVAAGAVAAPQRHASWPWLAAGAVAAGLLVWRRRQGRRAATRTRWSARRAGARPWARRQSWARGQSWARVQLRARGRPRPGRSGGRAS